MKLLWKQGDEGDEEDEGDEGEINSFIPHPIHTF
jgi:hypothetical protein